MGVAVWLATVAFGFFATPAAAAGPAGGWLRVGNFALGTAPVDIYIDGKVAAQNVAFEQVTPYAPVSTGLHTVVLRTAGDPANAIPIATTSSPVTTGSAATVLCVSRQNGLSASVYADDMSAPPPGNAKVRVIHVVGDAAPVDLFVKPAAQVGPTQIDAAAVTSTAPPVFSGLAFGSASPYANLPTGSYDVQLRATGSGGVLLSAHSWPVQAGTVASIVVFSAAKGVTLEVLRDAAGPSATPSGGMATGAGGMAHRANSSSASPDIPFVAGLAVLAVAGVGLLTRARRGTRRGIGRGQTELAEDR
jgi:hypothetical protein